MKRYCVIVLLAPRAPQVKTSEKLIRSLAIIHGQRPCSRRWPWLCRRGPSAAETGADGLPWGRPRPVINRSHNNNKILRLCDINVAWNDNWWRPECTLYYASLVIAAHELFIRRRYINIHQTSLNFQQPTSFAYASASVDSKLSPVGSWWSPGFLKESKMISPSFEYI